MARHLKELELSDLYDLLAVYTAKYTHLIRWVGPSRNLKDCEDTILELQTEIDLRKTQIDTNEQPNGDLDDGVELVPVPA